MNKKELVGKLPLFINCGTTDKKLDMLVTVLVDAINRKHFSKKAIKKPIKASRKPAKPFGLDSPIQSTLK